MDIFNKNQRSYIMSTIKAKHTKPEVLVRKRLFSLGFRYRLHSKKLPGNPDIVLPKYSVVIFVNGCFWHQHNCPRARQPRTRIQWWRRKLNANVERDKKNHCLLMKKGWRVLVIWECKIINIGLENEARMMRTFLSIDKFIRRGRKKKMVVG